METYGVDISKSAADAAAKRCGCPFCVGSVYHLPVADECCDMLADHLCAPTAVRGYHQVLHRQHYDDGDSGAAAFVGTERGDL